MKKWGLKKLFIIMIDVITAISLLLQIQATGEMYYRAAVRGWTLSFAPLLEYREYGFIDALLGSDSLIRSYTTYAHDKDIYYSIAEAVVNNYSLQILVNLLRWGFILAFFMSFAVIVMKIRGRKKGEKYLLPVAISIIYVVMRIIGVYQGLLQAFSQ